MRSHPSVTLRGDRNECPGCGELFNSSYAFDMHRTGRFGRNRRCMTVDEMSAAGMVRASSRFWISAAAPAMLGAARGTGTGPDTSEA